uniref:CoA-binding protein n=1 Tax=uncultured Tenacibaculum sp. TaxID=174713 RepID=UPI00261D8417|nr:CoA-binding protein [uncultured Tenacibaculum sp.]
MKKRTLVLGASLKSSRYSNIAIKRLRDNGIETVAIGLQKGTVADIIIETENIFFEDVDTVTLYLNPERQKSYYEYIVHLQPRRVIFNPGTENIEFMELLKENGIESEIACTLVLLSTKQY